MIALRVWRNSDILAATGQEGMREVAGEKFWTWRRILLAIGYGLVFITGLEIVFAADPNGLILMVAAILGFLFSHRTWLGIRVWTYVASSGLIAISSADDLGFYGLAAGIGFGVLALPWAEKRPSLRPVVHYGQQSPFIAALTNPNGQPSESASLPTNAPGPQPSEPPVATQPEPSPSPEPAPVPSADDGHVALRAISEGDLYIATVGKISLTLPWKDLTPDLLRRPVIGFMWLYLYAREKRKAGDWIRRSALIDEVAHGVADPRGRLRGYLRDLSHLPAPLGSMIKVEDELIGFDLQGQRTDIDELRQAVAAVKQAELAVEDFEIQHARKLLVDLGEGEFLPGFEEMEKRVTNGRGIAGQVVAEVRAQVHTLRADLAVGVANALLDRGQAADAVAILEPLVAQSEDRDDVVRTLINALRDSGLHSRVAEIRRRYAAGLEG